MAEVNTGDSGGGHGKHQKKRAKKASTRIDMTPMVDLAFLLLTFFVLTSTFNKPKTLEINYPADLPPGQEPPKINNALTFIMSRDNNLYYYAGQFYPKNNIDHKPETVLLKTDYSKDGLRKILLDANKPTRDKVLELEEKVKNKEIADTTFKRLSNLEKGKINALTVLVKSDDQATYKNAVDIIDELNISMVGKYAIVDMSAPELELLKSANDAANSPTN